MNTVLEKTLVRDLCSVAKKKTEMKGDHLLGGALKMVATKRRNQKIDPATHKPQAKAPSHCSGVKHTRGKHVEKL